MQNKLVVADLGAAGNLVKNLVLLSEDIHWPISTDRYTTISNQYNSNTNFQNWLDIEYQLRFWKKHYNIDLSDDLNFDLYQSCCSNKHHSAVFLNHSAFYQQEEFNKFKQWVDIIYVVPCTEFGLLWQLRSYCEKKTVELLHDFTFDTNREEQIKNYIAIHGHESYYRMNIANMKNIISDRQNMFKADTNSANIIALEDLIQGPIDNVIDTISHSFNISLPKAQVIEIVNQWRNLHWPIEETSNWKYYDCIINSTVDARNGNV